MHWSCKFGGLGFAGAVMPWSWFFYKSQPTKPEASLGIKFPELEFRFWAFPVKCRWFFGRVFSFPLVEEFV